MIEPRQDIADSDVVAAIEANTQAAFARWAVGLGAEVHHESDIVWYLSGVPFALCNGVIRSTLSPARAGERIDEAIRRYEAESLPMCWLVGGDGSGGV